MSKIAEQKALESYPPEYEQEDFDETWDMNLQYREPYIEGYDQALSDIKQRVKEIIEHQEKEWGKPNVDIGLYTILGYIVEKEENE